jgi:hypothetical protein
VILCFSGKLVFVSRKERKDRFLSKTQRQVSGRGAERNGARRQDRREPGEYFFVIFVIMVFWTFVSFVVKGFMLTTESTMKKNRGHREGDRWRNRRQDEGSQD